MTKISIVMPVYNSENYLSECLKSLINQTFKDFELICINDGSTDNSLRILQEYQLQNDGCITIISQKNSGAGASRNRGFGFVNSKTVIFLDSDDYFYPNFLEKMYDRYCETGADVVICRYDVCLPGGKIFQQAAGIYSEMLPAKEVFNKKDIPQYIFNFSNHAAWNKLIKSDLVKEHKLEFENTPDSNDVFFTLSVLFFAEKIAIVDIPLLRYNFLNENSTTINRDKYVNTFVFDSFKKLKQLINNNSLFEISLYNAYLSSVMYILNFLKGKNRRKFLKFIKNNVPLYKKDSVYKKYLYYRLLAIKRLPVPVFIILYKIKCTIKKLIPQKIKKRLNIK